MGSEQLFREWDEGQLEVIGDFSGNHREVGRRLAIRLALDLSSRVVKDGAGVRLGGQSVLDEFAVALLVVGDRALIIGAEGDGVPDVVDADQDAKDVGLEFRTSPAPLRS